MNEFSLKPKFFFGHGAIKALAELPIMKAYIICDPFMVESGLIDEVTGALNERAADYKIFSRVVPNPTIEVVSEGFAEISLFQPDTVIAFGGGSAMDSAKSIRKVYAESMKVPQPCLVAIPTTSGSGSEMTSVAVISDSKNNQKIPLLDDSLLADIAILDSMFTLGVPKVVTADAGMDVMTHCLEAYVATGANDFTDACAEKSMQIVWNYLVKTYNTGENVYARERMHNASSLAGIAFNAAGLGLCHGMAHAMGAFFHVAHGRLNAIILPHIIRYNARCASAQENYTLNRYARAAELLGLTGLNSTEKTIALIDGIRSMMHEMNMPETVTAAGIDRNDFLDRIPDMVERALADDCTSTNPRTPARKEVEEIYRSLL
ncbi:1-propanol dehydrogenase PduQ [Lactovum odontotermitis]